ncbi:MAG: PspC domain-containing protein [Acidimicrobiia bacterium]
MTTTDNRQGNEARHNGETAVARAPKKLERPDEGRILAGVAAGLGNRYEVSPWLPRLGFAVLAFFGGLGILLYLAGWLLIPKQNERQSIAQRWIDGLEGTQAWIGAILIVLAGLLFISWLGFTQSGLVWAVTLLVVGILLYRGDVRLPTKGGPGPPSPDEPGADLPATDGEEPSPTAGLAGTGGGTSPPQLEATAAAQPRPKRAPKPRSILGRLTVAGVLITLGVMAVLDNSGVIFPTARHYLAAALTVIGVALLVGAWIGRSRGAILIGLLILPFALAAAVTDVRLDARVGESVYRPDSTAVVQEEYRLGIGKLTVDLRSLEVIDERLSVTASVAIGEVEVLVPDDMSLTATGKVGIGEVTVLGVTDSGMNRRLTVTQTGTGALIEIEAEAGFGSVEVRPSR